MSDRNSLNVKGPLNAGVDQLVYETTITGSAVSSVTISGLDGDTSQDFTCNGVFVNGSAGFCGYLLQPNGDSGSNYGQQEIYGSNATVTAFRSTSRTGMYIALNETTSKLSPFSASISAKSGAVRTGLDRFAWEVSGTTVTYAGLDGHNWSNTASNITSITISASAASGIGVGSRIALYARRPNVATTNSANIKGQMTAGVDTIVYENTLSGSATSVTISGLDGDTDQAYRLIIRGRAGADSSPAIYLNNDNTAGNYGYQRLTGSNATTSASRNTSRQQADLCFDYTTSGNIWMTDTIINAKSGSVRTMTTLSVSEVSGTSVRDVSLFAVSWNNTVSNLTSIVLSGGYANCYGVGTYICLLRPSRSTTTANAYNSFSTPMGQLFADCFETIAEGTLGSDVTTATISGLDGNTDTVYSFDTTIKSNSPTCYPNIRLNDLTTCGWQELRGANTTVSAARATSDTYLPMANDSAVGTGTLHQSNTLIYAKSGYARTALAKAANAISGTTVTEVVCFGSVLNDTTTNITSLILRAVGSGGLGIGTRYRLQTLKRKV